MTVPLRAGGLSCRPCPFEAVHAGCALHRVLATGTRSHPEHGALRCCSGGCRVGKQPDPLGPRCSAICLGHRCLVAVTLDAGLSVCGESEVKPREYNMVNVAWTGSACTGTLSTFIHEQALAHARAQVGCRLPNVKELISLSDQGTAAATLDQAIFPDAAMKTVWSSTPYAGASATAMAVYLPQPDVRFSPRTNPHLGRLVRDEF